MHLLNLSKGIFSDNLFDMCCCQGGSDGLTLKGLFGICFGHFCNIGCHVFSICVYVVMFQAVPVCIKGFVF